MILYKNKEECLIRYKNLSDIDCDKFTNTIKAYSTTIPNPDNKLNQQHVNNSK